MSTGRHFFSVIRHILDMTAASGKKRALYAVINAAAIALGVLFTFCVQWLWAGASTGDINFIAAVVGIILCCALTIACVLHGAVAQIALVFIALVGLFRPGERLGNFCALLLAVGTIVAAIAVIVWLVGGGVA